MALVAAHLIITGKVQGVFYRSWTVTTARTLGLVGWVRNRQTGDVEAFVQGESDEVARFIALARQGPPAAQVAEVRNEAAQVSDLGGFTQRSTV